MNNWLPLPSITNGLVWLSALLVPFLLGPALGQAPKSPSFSRDIRPILSDNCFQCHGPDEKERKADLRLDAQPREIDSLTEELIRRVTSGDPDEIMPPPATKKKLDPKQIELLKIWVASGSQWESHWAFEAVRRETLPSVAETKSAKNAIDYFVLAKLETRGLKPSTEADRRTLIRRVFLDVLGITPMPAEVSQFVNDVSPLAYERLIDLVLASPRFGERWGRHWLDHARYADSDGYAIDGARVMWPYRDWVIKAVNDDMPFDQFTIEQLAGDLLPTPTTSQLVATGFHRNTLINQEGGSDPEQFRNETVVDRTNTTAAVWLGLTLGCAQCHTHKFDPISHDEYYRFFAFFNSTEDKNQHDPRILAAPSRQQRELESLQQQLRSTRDELQRREESKADTKEVAGREKQLRAKVAELEKRYGLAMIMRDLDEPRESFVHVRGDFLRHGNRVFPNLPEVLPGLPDTKTLTRLDLAQWLVDSRNPLTARVTVNRIWMQYFGRGLVETENDFGVQGTPPSHPELLDWLASELISHSWSGKAIHRMILTSATYRQASRSRADLDRFDPNNLLLGRQARLRVTSEVVRDLALSAAGMLTDRIGGPSVFPPQPEGVYAFTQNRKTWGASIGADRYRRGMYTFFYRSAAHPFLTTFDTPNFQTTCTKRLRSNTPLQSLAMSNDESMLEASRGLAALVMQNVSTEGNGNRNVDAVLGVRGDNRVDSNRLRFAFRRTLARTPTQRETGRLLAFLDQQRQSFSREPDAVMELVGHGEGTADLAAWIALSRVLLNLDEFVTRN